MNYGDHNFIEHKTKLRAAPVELVVSRASSHAVWTSSTQPKCMGSTRRTYRVVSRRDEPSGIWAYACYVNVTEKKEFLKKNVQEKLSVISLLGGRTGNQ